jgi:ABC-type multidrug transport system fused ATPase/permease subunit
LETQNRKLYYTDRLDEIAKEKQQTLKYISLFSWLRLLSFALFIVTIYFFSAAYGLLWLIVSVFFFVSLIVLVIYHQKLYHKSERLQAMFDINQNEIKHLEHQPSIFNNGVSYSTQLPFADDLDLFGPHSVFHYMNRCQTRYGMDLLANALLQPATDSGQIRTMQESVREFAGFRAFHQDVMVRLMLSQRKKDVKEVGIEGTKPIYLFGSKFYRLASWLMPVLVILSLIAGIITGNYALFMLNGTIAMMMVFRQSRKMMLLAEEIGGRTQSMKAYAGIFDDFGKLHLETRVLKEMAQSSNEASLQFRKLAALAEQFDRRNNILLFLVGNIFLMYDFQLGLAYENWKRRNLGHFDAWLETFGRIEFFVSLGTFAWNHPEMGFPELTDESGLWAKSLGHPLIPGEQLVTNDVSLAVDPRIILVTGSNMSGKSTFLRTLGVNVILAQMGAPVCAESFRWKPMRVLSSLRQSDSLQENTSLFLNELKQLKFILEFVQSDEFCLVLLDEILRGTNSDDKYTGSKQLIMKLLEYNSLVVMATHDLKLSQLETEYPQQVVNYCFESRIDNGLLLFDYTIRKGVAVNRNATWLMKDMGVID